MESQFFSRVYETPQENPCISSHLYGGPIPRFTVGKQDPKCIWNRLQIVRLHVCSLCSCHLHLGGATMTFLLNAL